MTLQELIEKLGVNLEDHATICVNGYDKEPKDVPMQGFQIEKITVHLENFNGCEITIYTD